jgi:hypothetical protein
VSRPFSAHGDKGHGLRIEFYLNTIICETVIIEIGFAISRDKHRHQTGKKTRRPPPKFNKSNKEV